MDFVVFGTGRNTALAELDAYLGNGDDTFRHLPAQVWPALPDAAGSLPAQLFLADFNHDGKPDLLFAQNDVELGLGNGDGTFQSPTTILRNFGPVAVGDVNHDGYLDLVQARNSGQKRCDQADNASGLPVPAATVYLGQANGQFAQGATYLAPELQGSIFLPALLGDFDGDGNLDLAIPYAPRAARGRMSSICWAARATGLSARAPSPILLLIRISRSWVRTSVELDAPTCWN
jgi:hypothetical protein